MYPEILIEAAGAKIVDRRNSKSTLSDYATLVQGNRNVTLRGSDHHNFANSYSRDTREIRYTAHGFMRALAIWLGWSPDQLRGLNLSTRRDVLILSKKKPERSNPEVFWGRAGAGILFTCNADDSVMLALRSLDVQEPGTWGITGGSCSGEGFYENDDENDDAADDPWECAVRETVEELKYFPKKYENVGKVVFKKGSFQYTTFIVDVPLSEKKNIISKSKLNWENDEIAWFPIDDAINLSDLHFGAKHVLNEMRYS